MFECSNVRMFGCSDARMFEVFMAKSTHQRQVPTRPTTITEIMASPKFALGVSDVRADRPFRAEYDHWDTNDQWVYERGRQWAAGAPRTVTLLRGGKVSEEAMRWFSRLDIL
jgi:hypothetical protein